MYFIRLIELIERIDLLIRLRATGSPNEFAAKLGISTSYWYKIKKILIEEMDFPIAYDPYARTYHYVRPGKFCFFFLKWADEETTGNSL